MFSCQLPVQRGPRCLERIRWPLELETGNWKLTAFYNPCVVRCTSAHVDLDATRANYQAIVAYLSREAALNRSAARGPGDGRRGIIAVVKANAYGHGAVRVARALEEAGATGWRWPTSRRASSCASRARARAS